MFSLSSLQGFIPKETADDLNAALAAVQGLLDAPISVLEHEAGDTLSAEEVKAFYASIRAALVRLYQTSDSVERMLTAIEKRSLSEITSMNRRLEALELRTQNATQRRVHAGASGYTVDLSRGEANEAFYHGALPARVSAFGITPQNLSSHICTQFVGMPAADAKIINRSGPRRQYTSDVSVVLNSSSTQAWHETTLAIAPVISDAAAISWLTGTEYQCGVAAQLQIAFNADTSCSHLVLVESAPFPLQYLRVTIDGTTCWTPTDGLVRSGSRVEIPLSANDAIGVTGQSVIVTFCQPSARRVAASPSAVDDLHTRYWDLATQRISDTPSTDALSDFFDEERPEQAATALQEWTRWAETISTQLPDDIAHQVKEIGKSLGSVARILTLLGQSDTIVPTTASYYEYTYGFVSVALEHRIYAATGRYVSDPLIFTGDVRQARIALTTSENIFVTRANDVDASSVRDGYVDAADVATHLASRPTHTSHVTASLSLSPSSDAALLPLYEDAWTRIIPLHQKSDVLPTGTATTASLYDGTYYVGTDEGLVYTWNANGYQLLGYDGDCLALERTSVRQILQISDGTQTGIIAILSNNEVYLFGGERWTQVTIDGDPLSITSTAYTLGLRFYYISGGNICYATISDATSPTLTADEMTIAYTGTAWQPIAFWDGDKYIYRHVIATYATGTATVRIYSDSGSMVGTTIHTGSTLGQISDIYDHRETADGQYGIVILSGPKIAGTKTCVIHRVDYLTADYEDTVHTIFSNDDTLTDIVKHNTTLYLALCSDGVIRYHDHGTGLIQVRVAPFAEIPAPAGTFSFFVATQPNVTDVYAVTTYGYIYCLTPTYTAEPVTRQHGLNGYAATTRTETFTGTREDGTLVLEHIPFIDIESIVDLHARHGIFYDPNTVCWPIAQPVSVKITYPSGTEVTQDTEGLLSLRHRITRTYTLPTNLETGYGDADVRISAALNQYIATPVTSLDYIHTSEREALSDILGVQTGSSGIVALSHQEQMRIYRAPLYPWTSSVVDVGVILPDADGNERVYTIDGEKYRLITEVSAGGNKTVRTFPRYRTLPQSGVLVFDEAIPTTILVEDIDSETGIATRRHVVFVDGDSPALVCYNFTVAVLQDEDDKFITHTVNLTNYLEGLLPTIASYKTNVLSTPQSAEYFPAIAYIQHGRTLTFAQPIDAQIDVTYRTSNIQPRLVLDLTRTPTLSGERQLPEEEAPAVLQCTLLVGELL